MSLSATNRPAGEWTVAIPASGTYMGYDGRRHSCPWVRRDGSQNDLQTEKPAKAVQQRLATDQAPNVATFVSLQYRLHEVGILEPDAHTRRARHLWF
jgi:hypothetical protein